MHTLLDMIQHVCIDHNMVYRVVGRGGRGGGEPWQQRSYDSRLQLPAMTLRYTVQAPSGLPMAV